MIKVDKMLRNARASVAARYPKGAHRIGVSMEGLRDPFGITLEAFVVCPSCPSDVRCREARMVDWAIALRLVGPLGLGRARVRRRVRAAGGRGVGGGRAKAPTGIPKKLFPN